MSISFGIGLLAAKAGKIISSPVIAYAIAAVGYRKEAVQARREQRSSEYEALARLDAMSDAELRDIGLTRGDLGAVLDFEHPTQELNRLIEQRYGRRH